MTAPATCATAGCGSRSSAIARSGSGSWRAQSPLGEEFLKRNRLPAQAFDSFYLVENAIILHKSTGFLSLVHTRVGPGRGWRVLLGVLPTHPLDRLYDWIAQNRFRWFGRRELCLIADEAKAERFLEPVPWCTSILRVLPAQEPRL